MESPLETPQVQITNTIPFKVMPSALQQRNRKSPRKRKRISSSSEESSGSKTPSKRRARRNTDWASGAPLRVVGSDPPSTWAHTLDDSTQQYQHTQYRPCARELRCIGGASPSSPGHLHSQLSLPSWVKLSRRRPCQSLCLLPRYKAHMGLQGFQRTTQQSARSFGGWRALTEGPRRTVKGFRLISGVERSTTELAALYHIVLKSPDL